MHHRHLRALLPAFALLPAMSLAGEPFSFDKAFGRLPKNVVPQTYDVSIVPDVESKTLTGRELITLDFREATDKIQFNSLNEVLSDVKLDGLPVKTVVSEDDKQLTTLTLAKPAKKGRHILTFTYSGKIESQPQGLFAQNYSAPGGAKGVMLSTQFEQTDARRMFPCWDEPAFRAKFRLNATIPAQWKSVSNMPIDSSETRDGKTVVHFKTSPLMPSYLVEFSAGDLASISTVSKGVTFGVWAVRGQEQDGAAALAAAQQILADYNEYFGVPYPLPKLDSIAVPGGFQGAMENWGAITYNDQALLVTGSSAIGQKQTVFSIQAHEMAHQWNGDLVTMGWWDDIWLNESFASWRAAKEVDERNPSWNWWQNEDGSKEGAMRADARVTSHAIQQHVVDELEATNAFDPEITYAKGEAVLRMFEAYLGPDQFRDGVRRLMKAKAYSNASSADLWNALSAASGRDVGAIAADWTERPGFPLVRAQAQCDAAGNRTVSLSQSRFLLQGEDKTAPHWHVPLRVRVGSGAPASFLLAEDGQTLAAGRCDESLSLNADTVGFYRVLYDDATRETNRKAFATLGFGDRIALLDDQWSLVMASLQPLESYLDLASSMGSDINERAWSQITGVLDLLDSSLRDTPSQAPFRKYAGAILRPLQEKLGWASTPDETPGVLRLRRTAITTLGGWGDEAVMAEAHKRFEKFVDDRSSLRPDDQSMVLEIVARHATAEDFAKLHEIAKSAHNETEQRRYFRALMLVADKDLAEQAGKIALSDEIPPQADAIRFDLIRELNDAHPELSWHLFDSNVDRLMAPQGPFAALVLAQYIPEVYWRNMPPEQLETWLKAHVPAQMADNMARGMESARFRIARKALLAPAVEKFLAAK